MNALINIQQSFKDSLLINNNVLEPYLNRNNTVKAYSPIDIYKNAYQLRLIESLKADYPILEKLLGTDGFNDLAIDYIKEYPSSSFTLRFFGQYLSGFLKKERVYQQQPYLAEMAEFEWCLADIFDVEDTQLATVTEMNRFSPEDWPYLTVKYHASVRHLVQHWNIMDVYQAILSKTTVPDLKLSIVTQHCLVWRKQYASFFRLVDSREWLAMKMLEQSTFSALCETLSLLDDSDEHSALNAATYLKTWLSTDLITSVDSVN